MLISAGIEKFYTFAQFFSVVFLSLGILATNLVGVFLFSRPPRHSARRRIQLLLVSFAVFLAIELALAVAPTQGVVRTFVLLDCVGFSLISRLFYLCTRSTFDPGDRSRLPYLIMVIEASTVATLGFARIPGVEFFSEILFDRVSPGPLFYVLLSLAAGWTCVSILMLAITAKRRTGRARTATILLIAAIVLLSGAYLASHLLPGNSTFPVFPPAVVAATALIALSLIRFNLLDLLLVPLDDVMNRVELLVLVINENGEVVSTNHDRFEMLDFGSPPRFEDILSTIASHIDGEDDRARFITTMERRGRLSGRITLADESSRRHAEYRMVPVTYIRREVGWLLTLVDTTEEEESILQLTERRDALERAYGELRIYAKTTLYHEAELERQKLMDRVNSSLERDLSSVAVNLEKLIEEPGSQRILESSLEEARCGLKRIREAVSAMKEPAGR